MLVPDRQILPLKTWLILSCLYKDTACKIRKEKGNAKQVLTVHPLVLLKEKPLLFLEDEVTVSELGL